MMYKKEVESLIKTKNYQQVYELSKKYFENNKLEFYELSDVIELFVKNDLSRDVTTKLVHLLNELAQKDDVGEDYHFPVRILYEHKYYEEGIIVCNLILNLAECSHNKEFIHLIKGECLFKLKKYYDAKNELEVACSDEDLKDEAWEYLKKIK